MTKTYCDKCKCEIVDRDHHETNIYVYREDRSTACNLDLCIVCGEEIISIMKSTGFNIEFKP